ncbi:hypothetical protein WA158_006289 [Blastocystis sp. Blastoise]
MFEYIQKILDDPTTVSDAYKSVMDGIIELDEYLSKHPYDTQILKMKYDCCIMVRRYIVARDTAKTLVAISGDNSEYHYMYGHAYMYLGDYENAQSILQKGAHLDPDNQLIVSTFKTCKKLNEMKKNANTVFANKLYEEAIQLYTNLIEYNGTLSYDYSSVAYSNRAACYSNMNKYEEALNDCNMALDIYPYFTKVYLRKARCMVKLNQTGASTMYMYYIYLGGNIHDIMNEYINVLKSENIYTPNVFILDVFASWCGPCKQLAPVLEEMSCYYKNIYIVKVDGDQNRDIAMKYKIEAFPTLLFFINDTQVDVVQGADINRITQNIDTYGYKHIDILPSSAY